MKKIIQYTAVLIALTFAASCNQIDYLDTENGLICFTPKSVETKAMVTNDNLKDPDLAIAFSVIDLMDTSTDPYIDDVITYDSDEQAWVYNSGNTYLWENGSHKFFGYTQGIGTLSGTTLTIPETILSTSDNQTDLLYSSIVSTTASAWKTATGHTTKTPVPLEFHHLLSAITITIENFTGSELTVESVVVEFANKAAATVSFGTSDDATKVVPTITGLSTSGTFADCNDITMDPDAFYDVLAKADVTPTSDEDDPEPTPFMIWPQSISEDNPATITITLSDDDIRTVPIPVETEWEAGYINAYNLRIYPESLDLVFEVKDWEQVSMPLNTNLGSINMSNVTWMNSKVSVDGTVVNTVNNGAYSVTMYYRPTVNGETYDGYFPAQGYFTVNYPYRGKFKIDLIPAYNQTTADLDKSKYEIFLYDSHYTGDTAPWRPYTLSASEEITNNTVYFQVQAAAGQDGHEYRAQLDIWFLPYGSDETTGWVSAYSEIRANYALIIPATN